MTVALSRGYTFGSTELVTNTKLHALVDSGSVSNIDETVFASGRGIVVRSTSTPSVTSVIWVDTNISPPVAKVYSGTEWQGTGSYGVFTNKSGGSVAAGDVVIVDTSNAGAFTTTNSANNQRVLGVVMQTIANNADGVVALPGARVELVSCNGSVSVGDYLTTSSTVKQAAPSSTPSAGVFAIALASRSGSGTITEAVLIRFDAAPVAATQAEEESASSTSVYTSPGRQQYHPGVVKFWVKFAGTSANPITADQSYNLSGTITKNGTGDYTLTFSTAFSAATYAFVGNACNVGGTVHGTIAVQATPGTTSIRIETRRTDNLALADFTHVSLICLGDQ